MQLSIQKISKNDAIQILNWKYNAPYDFYNNEESEESIEELLGNSYSVVVDERNQLIGFFCIGNSAQVPAGTHYGAYSEKYIDIGLGMRPELTGQGLGSSFFSFIINHVQAADKSVPLRLTVAKFNERAIRLYEKLGFKKKMEFSNGSTVFLTMVKDVEIYNA
ncbi:GNAT family N-acetyltransferase [Bacillus sp. S/N-304-OC-R1]|uniref:GNAT family N-acetyltransferase n=1 Tax=Bacillus sp. S/N-304-OC-R1 TaxID=2758034 RepID=UPI001C8E9DCD|nr:GNAT family protein [Bacillus sp. S/N-304-OC-R1]MBY0121295.1 GNAT family N-acetyltransferase [Bacillus sp. S/N-304-OC-R1]